MKINSVSICKNQNISHKAGHVRVFSDFDKTYLPTSHSDFKENTSPNFIQQLKDYFSSFRNYIDKRKDTVEFTITTGRTFDEFKKMAEISKEKELGMPLPDSLIVKNGSDEHLRIGTDKEFYETGKFPFKYNHTNKEKETRLLELTGWDGRKLKEKLLEILEKHDLRVVEAGSEHSVEDYGNDSFFAKNAIPYEGNKVFKDGESAEWVAGLRKDGNCKIYLSYPYDMNNNPERIAKRTEILNEFGSVLNDVGVRDCYSEIRQYPHECGGRPWQTFEPLLDAKLGIKTGGQNGLTKLFDTKEALRKAELNKDLVIAAGDSSNDFVMLNPILYFEKQIDKYNSTHPEKKFLAKDYSNAKKFIELLDSNDVLAKEFMELPFIGIIVTDDWKAPNKKLNELIEHFSEGKYKKIVTVKNGELEKGIDDAIKLHAKNNEEFKSKLKKELKDELFGFDSDLGDFGEEIKLPDTKSNTKYFIIGAIAILGALLINKLIKKNKKDSNNASTNK